MLAGRRVVTLYEAADAEFGPGDARDDDAISHQRRAGHGIAGLCGNVGGLDVPDDLPGLRVHGDQVIVQGGANDLAFVDGGAAIDDAAAYDAQDFRRIVMDDLPDLLAGQRVNGDRRVVVGAVDHAIGDQGESLRPIAVVHGIGPLGNEALDIALVDPRQGAIALCVRTHAIDQHIAGRVLILVEVSGGLPGGAPDGRERYGAREIKGCRK